MDRDKCIAAIKDHAHKLGWGVTTNHQGQECFCAAKCKGFLIAPTHDLSSVAFALMDTLANKFGKWLDVDNHHSVVWYFLPDELPHSYPFTVGELYSVRDAIILASIQALEDLP